MNRPALCSIFTLAVAASPPALAEDGPLSPALEKAMLRRFLDAYDHPAGGWSRAPKCLEPAHVELAMAGVGRGAVASEAMAQKTLHAAMALIAPSGTVALCASGGEDGPWSNPRAEQTASAHATVIRTYALAARTFGTRRYIEAARAADGLVARALTAPDGGIVAAGDDPRRTTVAGGAIASSLAVLYSVTGDPELLTRAVRAAQLLITDHKLPGGGFRAEATDAPRPLALADNLAAGQAMLELFATQADERWLSEAEDAAMFIARTFGVDEGGFSRVLGIATFDEQGELIPQARDPRENIEVARFTNLLHRYTGNPSYRRMADHAMSFLISREVLDDGELLPGVLLAHREMSHEPIRMIIVGDRRDPRARALHQAAIARGDHYRMVEWVEPGPAPLRYAFIQFPRPKVSAAIACVDGRCTPPVFQASGVEETWSELSRRTQ